MSTARGFGLNGKSLYTNVVTPKEVWCNFTVASSNTNGWGVTSVKSNGYIEAVFMHTSATPGKQGALTNPNPAAGYAVVRFKNNFNYFLGNVSAQIVPVTSPTTTALTAGNVYVITVLGTTTLAQWQAVGFPQGFTPAVGATFVASATASISGTGKVGLPGVPLAQTVAVVGDGSSLLNNSNIASNSGAQLVLQFSKPTAAGDTTLVAASPADGTVVSLQFCFDGSSVTIDGL